MGIHAETQTRSKDLTPRRGRGAPGKGMHSSNMYKWVMQSAARKCTMGQAQRETPEVWNGEKDVGRRPVSTTMRSHRCPRRSQTT